MFMVETDMTQQQVSSQGLLDIIPRRRYEYGVRPGVTNILEEDAQDKWVWVIKPELYSKEMKNRVIAQLMEILVTVTFKTHIYKLGRETLQAK